MCFVIKSRSWIINFSPSARRRRNDFSILIAIGVAHFSVCLDDSSMNSLESELRFREINVLSHWYKWARDIENSLLIGVIRELKKIRGQVPLRQFTKLLGRRKNTAKKLVLIQSREEDKTLSLWGRAHLCGCVCVCLSSYQLQNRRRASELHKKKSLSRFPISMVFFSRAISWRAGSNPTINEKTKLMFLEVMQNLKFFMQSSALYLQPLVLFFTR